MLFNFKRNGRKVPARASHLTDVDARPEPVEDALIATLFSLFDDMPAYICFLDRKHKVKYGNQQFLEQMGQPETAPCYATMLGRDQPCASCPPRAAFETGRLQEWEWTNSLSGRSYQARAYPVQDIDGTPLVFEMGIDITERRQAEQALRLNEQRYRALADENARLLDEVNHRVKNNLSAIIGLLYAEQAHARDDGQAEYRSLLADLSNRIRSMTAVHSMLSACRWSSLNLSTLTQEILSSVIQANTLPEQVGLSVSACQVLMPARQATNLGLAINELATNSIKYALPGRERLQIEVKIQAEGERVRFEYRDDGPGFPADVLAGQRANVGLFLVQAAVTGDLKGTVTLRNEKGGVVLIEFEKKTQEAGGTNGSQSQNSDR